MTAEEDVFPIPLQKEKPDAPLWCFFLIPFGDATTASKIALDAQLVGTTAVRQFPNYPAAKHRQTMVQLGSIVQKYKDPNTVWRYVPCVVIALLVLSFTTMGTVLVPIEWIPCKECDPDKPDCNRLACDPAWNASIATAECKVGGTPNITSEGRFLEEEGGHDRHDHDHRRLKRGGGGSGSGSSRSKSKYRKSGSGSGSGRNPNHAQDKNAPECKHPYPDNFCGGDFGFAHDSCEISTVCCDKNTGTRLAVNLAPLYLYWIIPCLMFYCLSCRNRFVDDEICQFLSAKNGELSQYNLTMDLSWIPGTCCLADRHGRRVALRRLRRVAQQPVVQAEQSGVPLAQQAAVVIELELPPTSTS